MDVIKGLVGAVLGFAGGMAVIVLLVPEDVVAGTAEDAAQTVAKHGAEEGAPFVRVALDQ